MEKDEDLEQIDSTEDDSGDLPDNKLNGKCHEVICSNGVDVFTEAVYKIFFNIMRGQAGKRKEGDDESVMEYLHSWYNIYLKRPSIKANLQELCKDNPKAIVTYLQHTFRNYIIEYNTPRNIGRFIKGSLEEIFSDKDDDGTIADNADENILDPSTEKDPYLREHTFPMIRDIIIGMPPKHQKAFLNMAYRHRKDSRDKFLENESQGNRNQLVKRMKARLREEFAQHSLTKEDFAYFLDSEYMSEIHILITSYE